MFIAISGGPCCFLCINKILVQELANSCNLGRIDDLCYCIIRTFKGEYLLRLLLKQIELLTKCGVDFTFGAIFGRSKTNGCSFPIWQVNVCAKVFPSIYSQFRFLACSGHRIIHPYSILNSTKVVYHVFTQNSRRISKKKQESEKKRGNQTKPGEIL